MPCCWVPSCPAAAAFILVAQDEKRDRFKLILNCIMIITSVIPPGECHWLSQGLVIHN
jgi:hypothetical protein